MNYWAHLKVLEEMGPQLGRPRVDTLNVVRTFEHERVAVRCGRRRLALRVRIRSETSRDRSMRRR